MTAAYQPPPRGVTPVVYANVLLHGCRAPLGRGSPGQARILGADSTAKLRAIHCKRVRRIRAARGAMTVEINMKPAASKKTRASYRPIRAVSVGDIRQMYAIYEKYYERTELETFLRDLSKKSGVILIRRKDDGAIVGFSTLQFFDFDVDGKRVRGVFSGDTVVEKDYWGSNALANTFYRRLVIERFKHPLVPFYWFLISKGYKTYLLMTNNFYNYYPHIDRENPRYRRIAEDFCARTFPEAFDRERMLLDFGSDYVALKETVADITPEERARDPKIAFFEQRNPSWNRGTELPCLAACDYESFFRSLWDVPAKWVRKHILGTHPRGPARPARPAVQPTPAAEAWYADGDALEHTKLS